MTKKRVLLISARADQGGGPKQVAQIMHYLDREFDFYIAAPDSDYFSDIFEKKSKKLITIPHRKFNLSTYVKLLVFLRENEIDVIHSHGFGAGIYSRLLGLFHPNVIHTFHGLQINSNFYSKLKIHIEKILTYTTKISIAVSHSEKTKLSNIFIHSVVCENGLEKSEISKRKIGHPTNDIKVLGLIHRLDPNKNIAWVIKNFHILRKNFHPNLKIIIAGEGEQKKEILDLIKKYHLSSHIKLIGFQEKYHFFDQIDLLFSASLGEGLPYTILEAMSYGVPILASNVPGHFDILEPSSLFELNSFSPEIEKIISNVKIHRERILKEYRIEDMIKRIKDYYNF
ncbi:MAG: hypothetical protein CME60_10915 [Halobacteriovoraceae bacterium]|nr:hypothetical protein [Halobacteriovoraceae bacterium]